MYANNVETEVLMQAHTKSVLTGMCITPTGEIDKFPIVCVIVCNQFGDLLEVSPHAPSHPHPHPHRHRHRHRHSILHHTPSPTPSPQKKTLATVMLSRREAAILSVSCDGQERGLEFVLWGM